MNEAATLTALTMLHSQPDDSHMTHYMHPRPSGARANTTADHAQKAWPPWQACPALPSHIIKSVTRPPSRLQPRPEGQPVTARTSSVPAWRMCDRSVSVFMEMKPCTHNVCQRVRWLQDKGGRVVRVKPAPERSKPTWAPVDDGGSISSLWRRPDSCTVGTLGTLASYSTRVRHIVDTHTHSTATSSRHEPATRNVDSVAGAAPVSEAGVPCARAGELAHRQTWQRGTRKRGTSLRTLSTHSIQLARTEGVVSSPYLSWTSL